MDIFAAFPKMCCISPIFPSSIKIFRYISTINILENFTVHN